jgi:hypothetical protein
VAAAGRQRAHPSGRMPETATQGLAPRVRLRAREQEGDLELGEAEGAGADHRRIWARSGVPDHWRPEGAAAAVGR